MRLAVLEAAEAEENGKTLKFIPQIASDLVQRRFFYLFADLFLCYARNARLFFAPFANSIF